MEYMKGKVDVKMQRIAVEILTVLVFRPYRVGFPLV